MDRIYYQKDFICLFKDKTENNMYESQFIK